MNSDCLYHDRNRLKKNPSICLFWTFLFYNLIENFFWLFDKTDLFKYNLIWWLIADLSSNWRILVSIILYIIQYNIFEIIKFSRWMFVSNVLSLYDTFHVINVGIHCSFHGIWVTQIALTVKLKSIRIVEGRCSLCFVYVLYL